MDSLSLLRDFNISNQTDRVVVTADRVNFGDSYVLPKASLTAFKGVQKDFYSLEVVLYLLKNRHLSHPEYMKQASSDGLGIVTNLDRKKLLDFLDGNADIQLDVTPGGLVPEMAAPPASDQAREEEPAAKKARLEEAQELSIFDALAKQERQLRNRNTMLIATGKNFAPFLELATKALTSMKALPQSASKQQQGVKRPHENARPASQSQKGGAIPVKPSGRFERENAADQLKAMAGEAATQVAQVIDMYGGYGSKSSSQPEAQTKPPPQSSSQRPSSQPRLSSSSAKPSSSSRHPPAPSKPLPSASKSKGGIPIILVPSGLTAMINLFNAKQFLEEGRFISSQAAQDAGATKHPLLVINRAAYRPPGKPVPYHVMDKPPAKDSDDWKRVVAVVAQGAKWQFKDFPFKGAAQGELVDTFSHLCGFYIHYSDEKPSEMVSNWNVKMLPIHRVNRHLDPSLMMTFFSTLDKFLVAKGTDLAY